MQCQDSEIYGFVHSWELVTALDGPGTRFILFLSGCPLRCLFCHNPDTWYQADGTKTSAKEIIKKILRYKNIFDATGGGLTITGGEPLQQPEFVEEIFAQAKANGISTALDTSGYYGSKASDRLLKNTSLVLLDVKSGIEKTYKQVTGVDLAPTIEFGNKLNQLNIPLWIRFVLVPNLTDSVDNIHKVAQIISKWKTVERVDVLPFHQYGKNKWHELKIKYSLENTEPPSLEQTETARKIFRSYKLNTY